MEKISEKSMVAVTLQDLVHSETIVHIKRVLAPILDQPEAELDPHAPMERYGIRPIMELTSRLEASLGWLPKTLFFEYQNLDELARYLAASFPEQVMKMVGMPVCPSDAAEEIKGISKYISHFPGGAGCVRDIIEQVMKLQGKWMNGNAFHW